MERVRYGRIRGRVLAALGLALLLAIGVLPPAAADEGGSQGDRPPAQKIDLNRATAEQLESIPGIGPSLAQRILDFRSKNGPFRRVEDLLKIKGIGEKSLQRMRSYVTVDTKA